MGEVIASLDVTEVLFLLLVLGAIAATGAVTVAKGHVALFAAGWVFALVWLIAAPRLAKPNSPWARRFYGPEKLERSQRRYPQIQPSQRSYAAIAATIGFGIIAAAFVAGIVDGMRS
jgi:hypothetical protein